MPFAFNCISCGEEIYAQYEDEYPQCAYCGTSNRLPEDATVVDEEKFDDPWRVPSPRMTTCFRCESTAIIPDVRIVDRGEGKKDLSVEVYRNPDALLFKRAAASPLRAWICASCGYTEIYASDTTRLKAAYDEMQGQGTRTGGEAVEPEKLGRLSISTSADPDGQLSLAHETGALSVTDDESSKE